VSDAPIADVRARAGVEAEHQSANRNMFERIAPTYDLLNRLLSGGTDARWRARAVGALPSIGEGAVLDLCAGTMDLSVLVARAHPESRIVALDFSAAMLEAGRRKVPQAEVVVGDAASLPFEDATFEAVICGFGMRNLADPSRGAREVARVLRPNGVFVTLELFRPAHFAARAFHEAYAKVVMPAIGGLVSGDRAAYRYLAHSMGSFFTREEYEDVLRAAGFRDVAGTDLTLGIASVVRGAKRDGAARAAKARNGGAT
jgi:ubiquinone/menaquinone biosynthesis methyltransferase